MTAKALKALRQLRKFVECHGWVHIVEENGFLRGLRVGSVGQWHWSASVEGYEDFLMFRAYSGMYVPEDRRVSAAEYLTRVNWGQPFGNFELNFSDGMVCYRRSIAVGGGGVSDKNLQRLVYVSNWMMEWYLKGLFAVSFGDVTPQQAIESAERDMLVPPAVESAPEASDDALLATIDEQPDDQPPETDGQGHQGRLGQIFPSDN